MSIGLTGGIGAGKSSVARLLAERGAVVVDADVLAREVVAPGTPGLAEVVDAFGVHILGADGAVDRPALGRVVFADPDARARLNAIVHPRVREAAASRAAAAAPGSVVVHDIPLLVENDLGPDHHLVLVVGASQQVRLERLERDRGMGPDDARARMAAQAEDSERRRVADMWVDNTGTVEATAAQVERLWSQRIMPYAENLLAGRRAERGALVLATGPGEPRPWAVQAETVLERLRRVGGAAIQTAHHVGSTAVPGLVAKDVLDLQIGVADLEVADELASVLAVAGFPGLPGAWSDSPKADDRGETGSRESEPGARWEKRFHANADPCRAVNVHVRVAGGPGWRFALMFRDWLRADSSARQEYARVKEELAQQWETTAGYAEAKEPWFDRAWPRMREWASATGWTPPPSSR
ncbi:dephospho-CoA kinase [Ruania halotolerans]|uniref:dephospho-CoA kinase n=1 Tax=Ruania halotolerans TaxID=2897773 RepID=UPI001E5CA0D1|nr:dephospho-CoA kinase [Ruania halotolerans]UFU08110.1 dephospho-CoA kinase [Ruania halotolerans]